MTGHICCFQAVSPIKQSALQPEKKDAPNHHCMGEFMGPSKVGVSISIYNNNNDNNNNDNDNDNNNTYIYKIYVSIGFHGTSVEIFAIMTFQERIEWGASQSWKKLDDDYVFFPLDKVF